MKTKQFDYAIPCGLPGVIGSLGISLLLIYSILTGTSGFDLSNIMCFLPFWLLFIILGVLFAYSSPAIRVQDGGIAVEYIPFLTRWRFFRWNQIDRVEVFRSPAQAILRGKKADLVIYSRQLPLVYLVYMCWYKKKAERGFRVHARIRGYEQLWEILETHCRFVD